MVSGLAKALRLLGHDARVVIPLYASIDRTRYGISFQQTSCVHMGNGEENWVGIHHALLNDDVPIYFVEYNRFFGRSGIYGEPSGEYGDNAFRFALLSKAAMQICKDLNFIPDVMHVHDWPTALVSAYLKTWDRILSPLSATASVLTIHNVGYPGVYHASALPYIGLGWEYFTSDLMEDNGRINLLKTGIHFSDAITTVSPTHGREILEPVGGQGLAPYLNNRRADLFGILNGVDYDEWNPATDTLIPATYSPDDMSGKATCKTALQKQFGLTPDTDRPVFGIVSRFASQKGFGLLTQILPYALSQMKMQFVALGSGDRDTENFFHWLTAAHPGQVGSYIGFSNERSHLVEAGSDFFLMPSLYEPCGLNQIYSMKYGTLPLVRATGGLADTVQNYNEATGDGTGFVFGAPTPAALYDTIGWAVSTYFDRPQHIAQMQQQAMALDFSWPKAAKEYETVYAHAIRNRRL